MEQTYNNWFTTNIAERLTNKSVDYVGTINWTYKPQTLEFLDACRFTASVIPKDKPWFLAYSGGADSEFVLRFLHTEKIPFTAVMVVTRMNKEEAVHGLKICKELGITPVIITMTAAEFTKKYAYEIAKKLNGMGPYATPTLVVAEYAVAHGGYCITGNHLQDEFQNNGDGIGRLDTLEYDAYNTALLPGSTKNFLDYTIEVVYAMAKAVPQQDFSLYKCKFYGIEEHRKYRYKGPDEAMAIAHAIEKGHAKKKTKKHFTLMTKAAFVRKVEQLAK